MTTPSIASRFLARDISAGRYFSAVAVLTLALFAAYIGNHPLLRHQLGRMLGIIAPPAQAENAFYTQRVQPIFDQYCSACHGEQKAKGALRLDNYLHARYSGKSRRAVLAHRSQDSAVLSRLHLPPDDKRVMPPLGWDRPNAAEITVVKLWIDKGASGQLGVEQFPEAPPAVKKITIPPSNREQVQQARAPLARAVAELQRQFPHSLRYLARNTAELRFSSASLSTALDDRDFRQLDPIAGQLSSVFIRDAALTEASADTLLKMTQLKDAYLHGVDFRQTTLRRFIASQQQMQRLSLHSHLVTPDIRALCAAKHISLRELRDD